MKLLTSYLNIIIFLSSIPNLCIAQNSYNANLSMSGHILNSTINSKSYQLYISLPSDYNAKDSKRYPVLYVLDAHYSYPLISSLHNLLDSGQEIEKIIIVAIGDSDQSTSAWLSNRMIDYTPSNDPKVDIEIANGLDINTKIKTGGGKSFLNTIRTDIIPFIDNNYKTTDDRGISGHSVGGLFASYCLFNAPDLFKRYAINSPSLFWNNQEIISLEKKFAIKNTNLDAKIFISYGSLEPEIMLPPINSFIGALKSHNYKGMKLITQVFENESHISVVGASTSRSLKVLYGI